MRWSDERFVKVYTRDTPDWLALGWEAHALFWELLRKSDRAGLFELGRSGNRGIAALTGIPVEVVDRALPVLLEDGCVEQHGAYLLIRNFIDAQSANQSDKARQSKARELARNSARAKDAKASQNVTVNGEPVTNCDSNADSVTGTASPVTPRLEETRKESTHPPRDPGVRATEPAALANAPGKPTPSFVAAQFGVIRAETCGGSKLFWQASPKALEKLADWLGTMQTDAVVDIEKAMKLACEKVRDGEKGWTGHELTDPNFLLGAVIAKWSALREEIHGVAPKAKEAEKQKQHEEKPKPVTYARLT